MIDKSLVTVNPAASDALAEFFKRNIAWAVVVLGAIFLTLSVDGPGGLSWLGLTLTGLAAFFDTIRNGEGEWPNLQYIPLWMVGGYLIGAATDERLVFMGIYLVILGIYTAGKNQGYKMIQEQDAIEAANRKEDPPIIALSAPEEGTFD